MSSTGWAVVRYDFEKKWRAAHTAGKVHVHERSRILNGDISPITRELEPDFSEGQEIVLSWSREIRQALYDDFGKLTGEVAVAPRRPLFVITIRDVQRHRSGEFRVRFHVLDRRETIRLPRRTPPALREGDYAEATAEEVEQATEESGYTSNVIQAVDTAEAVDELSQRRFAAEAHAIQSLTEQANGHRDAEARRQQQSLERDLADALAQAEAKGIDTSSIRFVTERQIARLRRRLERVA